MLVTGPLTRLLTRRTLRTVLGLLLLVEAIFIAESFTTIMEQTVRNGGSLWDLAVLVALKSPEVVDFALPLALVLGLFFAIQGARDDNELVICATSGVPWTRIPAFAATIGAIALCVSLVFAGILTPLSAFAHRLSLFHMETRLVLRQLQEPGQRTIVRTIDGQTVIATPSNDPGAERGNLFLYKPEPGGGWRVNQADDWSAIGPDADGNYVVRMRTFRESSGTSGGTETASQREPGEVRQLLGGVSVTVSTVTMDLKTEDLLRAADTTRRRDELLIFGLARRAFDSAGAGPNPNARRFGEMLARALMCPIAAMIAVAAAAWSATRVGRYAALLVAVVLVLGLDIAARALIGDAAFHGGIRFWLGILGFAMFGLGAPLAYVLRRGEAIVTPPRGRA